MFGSILITSILSFATGSWIIAPIMLSALFIPFNLTDAVILYRSGKPSDDKLAGIGITIELIEFLVHLLIAYWTLGQEETNIFWISLSLIPIIFDLALILSLIEDLNSLWELIKMFAPWLNGWLNSIQCRYSSHAAVFVLDESGSISYSDFEKQIQFVRDVTNDLNSSTAVMLGLVGFSSSSYEYLRPTDDFDSF